PSALMMVLARISCCSSVKSP
ncbi:hypothetical protein D030_1945B, partial [Vibrio parahaemolyticus AQ3810]